MRSWNHALEPLRAHRTLERLTASEPEALVELYEALGTPLYAMALRICGQTAAAELAVETLFREVWAQRGTIADDARVLVPRMFARCSLLARARRATTAGSA